MRMRTMPDFTIEYYLSEPNITVYIVITGYEFGDPGRLNGRPEDCYPPEGSSWSFDYGYIKVRDFCGERDKYGRLANNGREFMYKEVRLPNEFIEEIACNDQDFHDIVDDWANEYDDSMKQDYYDQKAQARRDEEYDR